MMLLPGNLSDLNRRPFNLVEITIALMILGIGLIAILGVFPIAANNTREATGSNYSAAAGEEILNYIASRVGDEWAIIDESISSIDPITEDLADVSAAEVQTLSAGGWGTAQIDTGIGDSGIYFKKDTNDNFTFRIVIETETTGGATIRSFDGLARVWKSPTKGFYYDGSTMVVDNVDTNYERSAQLNIELSWPATLPYSARTKTSYVLEVAKND